MVGSELFSLFDVRKWVTYVLDNGVETRAGVDDVVHVQTRVDLFSDGNVLQLGLLNRLCKRIYLWPEQKQQTNQSIDRILWKTVVDMEMYLERHSRASWKASWGSLSFSTVSSNAMRQQTKSLAVFLPRKPYCELKQYSSRSSKSYFSTFFSNIARNSFLNSMSIELYFWRHCISGNLCNKTSTNWRYH